MFESLSLHALQLYWWAIIALLGGLFVFIMFVQGGQTLLSLAQDEIEKRMMINSLGRKWELGFTTLVLFGGALFAAFPKFYSASFGGAYWLWLGILFSFIIQAVSYEYRAKPNNLLGARTYEAFLWINGVVGTLLLGIAISTFFGGAPYLIDDNNFVHYQDSLRGLEALLVIEHYLLAFAMLFLVRIIAAMYFLNNIDHQPLHVRLRRSIKRNTLAFLPFFLGFLAWLLSKEGYAYGEGGVVIASYKYLENFLQMPLLLGMLILGVVLVLFAIVRAVFLEKNCCIYTVAVGTVLAVTSILLCAGMNGTAFYPSLSDPQSSITIENASGSHYTLSAMSYASLMVPFVLGYIALVWRAMDRVRIDEAEMHNDEHHY
ncbi:MAG: cytochrome d ubiquinol oxidase subunit II [Campylobacterales bacterium]|nr:cytochrome d ubiquinol oxidase subunit II [Campylobacterales bacterium]